MSKWWIFGLTKFWSRWSRHGIQTQSSCWSLTSIGSTDGDYHQPHSTLGCWGTTHPQWHKEFFIYSDRLWQTLAGLCKSAKGCWCQTSLLRSAIHREPIRSVGFHVGINFNLPNWSWIVITCSPIQVDFVKLWQTLTALPKSAQDFSRVWREIHLNRSWHIGINCHARSLIIIGLRNLSFFEKAKRFSCGNDKLRYLKYKWKYLCFENKYLIFPPDFICWDGVCCLRNTDMNAWTTTRIPVKLASKNVFLLFHKLFCSILPLFCPSRTTSQRDR